MIYKEAWYKEIIALYGDPDPNDPESFYRLLDDPKTYYFSVGGEVKAFIKGYWTVIWHGSISEGQLNESILDHLEEVPGKRWYKVHDNPLTWQMNLEGESPFGWGEWSLFGFSSDEWQSTVEGYIDPFSPESSVVSEFQLQVREGGARVPVEQERLPENRENSEAQVSALLDYLLRVPPPPMYASYLSQAFKGFLSFRNDLRTAVRDMEVRRRLLESSSDLKALADDFITAAEQSRDSSQFPSVMVPAGLYQYVLTGEYPEEGPSERPREEEGAVPGVFHGPHGG